MGPVYHPCENEVDETVFLRLQKLITAQKWSVNRLLNEIIREGLPVFEQALLTPMGDTTSPFGDNR